MDMFHRYIEWLKQEIFKQGKMSTIGIIRFVYIDLGRRMNFNTDYTFGNKKKKEEIEREMINSEKVNEYFEERAITCKIISKMLTIIYDEIFAELDYKFNCKLNDDPCDELGVELGNGLDNDPCEELIYECCNIKDYVIGRRHHYYNEIVFKDGRKFCMDLEEDLEKIQTNTETDNFGLKNVESKEWVDFIDREKLMRIDKEIAIYIPWNFYFDKVIRNCVVSIEKESLSLKEKLEKFLSQLYVIAEDKKMGYRERMLYHSRIFELAFSEKEKNKITLIDYFRESENGKREYNSAIALQTKENKHILYWYISENTGVLREVGRYKRIDSKDEYDNEIINNGWKPIRDLKIKFEKNLQLAKDQRNKAIDDQIDTDESEEQAISYFTMADITGPMLYSASTGNSFYENKSEEAR